MKNTRLLVGIALAVFVAVIATTAVAAPLPAGTKLGLTHGVGSALDAPCATGSCFGMDVAPDMTLWIDFGPGTDGGFVVAQSEAPGSLPPLLH